jgi:hypothetical protein
MRKGLFYRTQSGPRFHRASAPGGSQHCIERAAVRRCPGPTRARAPRATKDRHRARRHCEGGKTYLLRLRDDLLLHAANRLRLGIGHRRRTPQGRNWRRSRQTPPSVRPATRRATWLVAQSTHTVLLNRARPPSISPIATGNKLRLFRRTWAKIEGKGGSISNNGDIVEVVGRLPDGLMLRDKDGRVGGVQWRRREHKETGRLLVGFGHAMTIEAVHGITSDEHINTLPRPERSRHWRALMT